MSSPGWSGAIAAEPRGRLVWRLDAERVEQEARRLRVSGNRSTPVGVGSEVPCRRGFRCARRPTAIQICRLRGRLEFSNSEVR